VDLYNQSYALLVGVSDYTQGWPPLNQIPSEVEKVANALNSQGFQVEKVINPDEQELEEAFSDFIDDYGYTKKNRLLFYYAGHGYTMDDGKEGFLVPTNAPDPREQKVNFMRKSLNMAQIISWCKQMQSKHALFLFDSCFSGTIFKQRDLPDTPPQIKSLIQKPVRQFITAGTAGESVPADSTFTPAFVDAIRHGLGDLNKDGYISGTELGLYLQKKVPKHTSQTPQYGKITDYELSRGDFVFLAGGGKAEVSKQSEEGKAQSHTVQKKPSISKGAANVTGGKAILHVKSEPSQARIYLDGKELGKTPLSRDDLVPGKHRMKVGKSHFQPKTQEINLATNVVKKYSVHLNEGRGSLTVLTTPSAAEVFVDGNKKSGQTPMTLKDLICGKHTVKIMFHKRNRKFEIKKEVNVSMEQTKRLEIDLEKYTPSLTVNTEPSSAEVHFVNKDLEYHDGIELSAGRYRISVFNQGYKKSVKEIKLMSNQEKEIQITLQPMPEPANREAGYTWIHPVTGMEFVWVPGGCYQMGCGSWTDHCNDEEKPVHEVCVDGFWMGKYEVTQGEWKKIMGSNPSNFERGDNYPVEQVSWHDCQDFIDKLNARSSGTFRLPTEAEWEYAARSGGKRQKYAGGDDVDRVAWYGDNSGGHTHKVGTKAPNGLDIYDMSGNAWEWCKDIYDSEAYSRHTRSNPVLTSGGSKRVTRGGNWYRVPRNLRVSHRGRNNPGKTIHTLGFRLCLPQSGD
jgi:formylglycine-generating enzyme required for sulfatase activity